VISGLTYPKDTNGDEEDGSDEVIYPMDHDIAGYLVDDDMHEIMVRNLPIGCRLTVRASTYSNGKSYTDIYKNRRYLMCVPLQVCDLLSILFQSCHSGSVLDLPYMYSTEGRVFRVSCACSNSLAIGKIKEPNQAIEAGKDVIQAISAY
jgi:hypothetical protein